jgi:hypothetical protein
MKCAVYNTYERKVNPKLNRKKKGKAKEGNQKEGPQDLRVT